ncbi:hypothetical protein Tco_0863627 [Tanacetum coccineum]
MIRSQPNAPYLAVSQPTLRTLCGSFLRPNEPSWCWLGGYDDGVDVMVAVVGGYGGDVDDEVVVVERVRTFEKRYPQNKVQQMGGARGRVYAIDGGICRDDVDGEVIMVVMMEIGWWWRWCGGCERGHDGDMVAVMAMDLVNRWWGKCRSQRWGGNRGGVAAMMVVDGGGRKPAGDGAGNY